MVQFQLLLHTIELLLKLELVQLPLRLVQLLRAWLGCETRANRLLVPQLGEFCLSGERLRGQGVELFSHREALCNSVSHLALAQHVHQCNTS